LAGPAELGPSYPSGHYELAASQPLRDLLVEARQTDVDLREEQEAEMLVPVMEGDHRRRDPDHADLCDLHGLRLTGTSRSRRRCCA
jgi:hypothetical protein